jgi:cytochrome P450
LLSLYLTSSRDIPQGSTTTTTTTTTTTSSSSSSSGGRQGEGEGVREGGRELSDRELRDILLNFVIAGRDTTAQALSWALLELATHADVQQRARDEIKAAIASPEDLTYDVLSKLRYLECVCLETLRLHPSVPKEAKYCVKDDVLPDGFKVHAGDSVCFFPWVMGRSAELWGEDCLEFKPERFLGALKPSPFVFTAFQAGPRACLGQSLAMLEMKSVLSRLLWEFCFAPTSGPGFVSPPSYGYSLTLPMDRPLKLAVSDATL